MENRRRAERIRLPEPLDGMLDSRRVSILDIGLLGAKIDHEHYLEEGATLQLRFFFGGGEIDITSRIAHSESRVDSYGQEMFQSGIEFIETPGESGKRLRQLIALHVTRMLEEQKANARGERAISSSAPVPFLDSGSEKRAEPAGFVTHQLNEEGFWVQTDVPTAKQPSDGFTVHSDISDEELALLRQSYVEADPSVRHLIRAMAEISLAGDKKR
jgi:hypothetical protein